MKAEDQVVEYFSMTLIRTVIPEGAPMIMVYKNPDDYPETYTARLYNGKTALHVIALAETLEELRATKPGCMRVIDKQEKDPPKVVETWL